MAEIAAGRQAAFRELFDRHGSLVLGYCRRMLGDIHRAEDVAQEAWMKIIRASAGYKAEGKFRAWLLTIARTSCLSELRGQRDFTEIDQTIESQIPDPGKDSFEAIASRQSVTRLKKEIDALPANQRAVLVMWMSNDLSYEEIASELAISVASVKSLLFRARQNLEKSVRAIV